MTASAYAAAVGWALLGIAVKQRRAARAVSAAAAAGALPVVGGLLAPGR